MNTPLYPVERDRQDKMKRETIETHKTFPQLNQIHMAATNPRVWSGFTSYDLKPGHR